MSYYNYTLSDSPVKVGKAVSYSFWFKPFGWMICTTNEDTGEFHIVSDWGNFSHRWDPKNLGEKSLARFLAKAHLSYICQKLAIENSILAAVIDEEETAKAIKTQILQDRRCLDISTRAEAQDLLYQLEDWEETGFTDATIPEDLQEREYFSIRVMRDSPAAEVLKKLLLPTFQKYLKEVVIPAENVNTVES